MAVHGEEAPIDPEREIVDPHHHFWDWLDMPETLRVPKRFLFPELLEAMERSGHKFTHTVFVQCHAMHRADGPDELKPVGETEFVNGIAAMSASGNYGPCKVAAGIVGTADLLLGAAVAPVLEAHLAAGGGRFRGIRFVTAYSEAGLFGFPCDPRIRGVMMNPAFRAGAAVLADMGLSLDVWCCHSQLPELIDLASALPNLRIVLDHIGTPEIWGAGRPEEVRAEWQKSIVELARRPNVSIKLGGVGMNASGSIATGRKASSEALAEEWRPWFESCIAAFGHSRCMFESNFPPDNASGSYGATWNAFKRIAASHSEDEKTALFSGTARDFYRLA